MKTTFTLFLCLLFLGLKAQIQEGTYTVLGRITDSISQKSLSDVTVNLQQEGKVLKSTLTDESGKFSFTGLKTGKYQIILLTMGYSEKSFVADLSLSKQNKLDLGDLLMNTNSKQLKEVVFTAAKPLVKQEADRISYDLQADPESKVKNVLEMMKKVPLLSVDADDNILMKGSGSYKILINGKPSGMVERNPKDVLRSMPASNIEKIEVITTPPSKYDGEGIAGIINIITHKDITNGYNGSINMKESFPSGGPNGGASFTLKKDKLGLATYGGLSAYHQPSLSRSFNRKTFGDDPGRLSQIGQQDYSSDYSYVNAELSYEMDSLNLISGQMGYNRSHSDGSSIRFSEQMTNDVLKERYKLTDNRKGNGAGMDLALNYQLGFKSDKNRMLTFSYRYFNYDNIQDDGLVVADAYGYHNPDYQQHNNGSSSEHTFQVDYTHPFKKLVVEAGLKGILRGNDSDFSYMEYNSAGGEFIPDPSRSNAFRNSQDVLGMYNSYQYTLKDWGFKGGLRVEKTFIHANFISSSSELQKNYLNVIPSLSVNRNFKNGSSVSMGYNTRMQRPGIYQLNPFVDRSNPAFERSGNPDLHPTTGKMIQLNYSRFKKGSINTSLGYMFINDLVMPLSVYNATTQVTRTTYGNTGKARLLSFNLYVNQPLSKEWNANLSCRMNYGVVEGLVNGIKEKNEGLMPGAVFSTSYKFKEGLGLNASLNYNGKNINLQGKGNSYTGISCSVNKDLLKEKLSLSLAGNNLLTKYRYSRNFTEGFNFEQRSEEQYYARSFSLSLNYRFGDLKGGIKKSKKSISNDDVNGGVK